VNPTLPSRADRAAPLPPIDRPASRAFRLLLLVTGLLIAWGAWQIPALFDANLDPLRGTRVDPERLVLVQWLGYFGAACLIVWAGFYRQAVDLLDGFTASLVSRTTVAPGRRERADAWERWLSAGFVALAVMLPAHLLVDRQGALMFAEKDGPLEMVIAVLYLAVAYVNVRLATRFAGVAWTRPTLLGLAGLFFFVGTLEIGWGERLSGLSTTEVLDTVNARNGFDLHDLWSTSLGSAIGLGMSFFLLVALPIGYRRSARCRRLCDALGAPVAPATMVSMYGVALAATCVIGTELGTLGLGPRSLYGLEPQFDDAYLELLVGCLFLISSLAAWRLRAPLEAPTERNDDAHAGVEVPVP
jgi:hypothetical protein